MRLGHLYILHLLFYEYFVNGHHTHLTYYFLHAVKYGSTMHIWTLKHVYLYSDIHTFYEWVIESFTEMIHWRTLLAWKENSPYLFTKCKLGSLLWTVYLVHFKFWPFKLFMCLITKSNQHLKQPYVFLFWYFVTPGCTSQYGGKYLLLLQFHLDYTG